MENPDTRMRETPTAIAAERSIAISGGGNKQAQRELIDRHGGIISLFAKRQYQTDRREELHTYTDEELATELRQRGFEVWKWDRLPDWKENL